MAKSKQIGLRLDESDECNLKRIANLEGRGEQEVLRDALRMYVCYIDDQQEFIKSVERGWVELEAGLGRIVTDDEDFFGSIKRGLRDEKTTA